MGGKILTSHKQLKPIRITSLISLDIFFRYVIRKDELCCRFSSDLRWASFVLPLTLYINVCVYRDRISNFWSNSLNKNQKKKKRNNSKNSKEKLQNLYNTNISFFFFFVCFLSFFLCYFLFISRKKEQRITNFFSIVRTPSIIFPFTRQRTCQFETTLRESILCWNSEPILCH